MAFTAGYCNSYVLLLATAVNLLLCLIYKLNFIVGMYRKKQYVLGSSTTYGLRHPLGFLECIPHR